MLYVLSCREGETKHRQCVMDDCYTDSGDGNVGSYVINIMHLWNILQEGDNRNSFRTEKREIPGERMRNARIHHDDTKTSLTR